MAFFLNRKECIGIDIGLNVSSVVMIRRKEKVITEPYDKSYYEKKFGKKFPVGPQTSIYKGRYHIVLRKIFKSERQWKTQFKRITERAHAYLDTVRNVSQTAAVALEEPFLRHGAQKGFRDSYALFFLTWYLLYNSGYSVIIVHPQTVKQEAGVGKADKSKGETTKGLMVEAFRKENDYTIGNFNNLGKLGIAKANKETLTDAYYIARVGLKHVAFSKYRQATWAKSPIYQHMFILGKRMISPIRKKKLQEFLAAHKAEQRTVEEK